MSYKKLLETTGTVVETFSNTPKKSLLIDGKTNYNRADYPDIEANYPDGIEVSASNHGYCEQNISAISNGSVICVVSRFDCRTKVSSDGINWTVGYLPSGYEYVNIAWNGTVFCVVGMGYAGGVSDCVATSPDGITWTQRSLPSSMVVRGIASNGSIFCILGYNTQYAYTSSNGISWTQRSMPSTANWRGIAWNGSIFCAVSDGSSNKAATSPDGITWTARTLPASGNWNFIAWNGSVFCTLTYDSSTYATSPNGITWTQRTLPSFSPIIPYYASNIGVKNDIFYIMPVYTNVSGEFNHVLTSSDGINWNTRTLSEYLSSGSACTHNGVSYIFCSYNYKFLKSSDTINWEIVNFNFPPRIRLIHYFSLVSSSSLASGIIGIIQGTAKFIFSPLYLYELDKKIYFFPEYPRISTFDNASLFDVRKYAHNSDWLVGITSKKIIRTSANVLNWSSVTVNDRYWYDITYNGTVFCAIAMSTNIVMTSSDTTTWTERTLPNTRDWFGITSYEKAGTSTICAIAQNSNKAVISTNNGVNWSEYNLPSTANWRLLASSSNLFIAVAFNDTKAAYSSDGITWNASTLPEARIWTSFCYGNGLFCLNANDSNLITTTTDGITWTDITLPITDSFTVCWCGNFFLGVSKNNTTNIIKSYDGINWTASNYYIGQFVRNMNYNRIL